MSEEMTVAAYSLPEGGQAFRGRALRYIRQVCDALIMCTSEKAPSGHKAENIIMIDGEDNAILIDFGDQASRFSKIMK